MRKLLIPCLLALLATACAKQGFPSGGPKDTAPPVPVGCQPANESRNFDGNRFFVEFDEYVVLKDAANNVLVSPPLKQTPEYKTKGRGFVVQMADTLQPNTTYLFQFKEAIADFTEGNVLPSYEYVFSTGDAMDTMMLAGSVLQARNGKPWTETVSVLALGAGAISKWLFDRALRNERAPNVRNIDEYVARVEEMVQRKRSVILK